MSVGSVVPEDLAAMWKFGQSAAKRCRMALAICSAICCEISSLTRSFCLSVNRDQRCAIGILASSCVVGAVVGLVVGNSGPSAVRVVGSVAACVVGSSSNFPGL